MPLQKVSELLATLDNYANMFPKILSADANSPRIEHK
jgi:hypothetical protein